MGDILTKIQTRFKCPFVPPSFLQVNMLLLLLLLKIVKLLRSLLLLFISLNLLLYPLWCCHRVTYHTHLFASHLFTSRGLCCMQGLTQSLPTAAHCSTNTGKVNFPGSIFTTWRSASPEITKVEETRKASRPALLDTETCFTLFKVDRLHRERHPCPLAPMPCSTTSQ